jgi:hypothetical protein
VGLVSPGRVPLFRDYLQSMYVGWVSYQKGDRNGYIRTWKHIKSLVLGDHLSFSANELKS